MKFRDRYDLIQEGVVVASVECDDQEQALKEINHYAFVYSQDGPVEIKRIRSRKGGRKP